MIPLTSFAFSLCMGRKSKDRLNEEENLWSESRECISCNATQQMLLNQEFLKATPLLVYFVICTNYYPISETIVAKQKMAVF